MRGTLKFVYNSPDATYGFEIAESNKLKQSSYKPSEESASVVWRYPRNSPATSWFDLASCVDDVMPSRRIKKSFLNGQRVTQVDVENALTDIADYSTVRIVRQPY